MQISRASTSAHRIENELGLAASATAAVETRKSCRFSQRLEERCFQNPAPSGIEYAATAKSMSAPVQMYW